MSKTANRLKVHDLWFPFKWRRSNSNATAAGPSKRPRWHPRLILIGRYCSSLRQIVSRATYLTLQPLRANQ